MQGDWNAKIGEEACKDWKGTCGHHCNTNSNDRGRRLLEFASYNDLMVSNTFGPPPPINIQKNHLAQPRRKDAQPNWLHHGEEAIQNKCEHCQDPKLPSSRQWKRPWTVHDDLQVTSREIKKKQCNTRIRFDLEKLKDPEVAEIFQAKIVGTFAALSILDSDMDMLTDIFNTAVTDTANEILGKYSPVKKPWVTTDILDLCAKRRKLKNKKKQQR